MKSLKTFSVIVTVSMVWILESALFGTPAFGQQKYVLKFNHVLGQKEPYHQGFLNWAKTVDEKTKGGLKIEVFPSAQLGVEEDILEQIRAGANIGQNTDSAIILPSRQRDCVAIGVVRGTCAWVPQL